MRCRGAGGGTASGTRRRASVARGHNPSGAAERVQPETKERISERMDKRIARSAAGGGPLHNMRDAFVKLGDNKGPSEKLDKDDHVNVGDRV